MEINEEEKKLIYAQDINGGGGKTWGLEKDSKYGRYLIALRNVEPGEILFVDYPLVHGPVSSYNNIICITCYRYLTEAKECRGCSWPVCGDHCPFKSTHTSQECNLLAKKSDTLKNKLTGKFNLESINYNALLTIRILLFKLTNQEKWKKINLLDPQIEDWKQAPNWLDMEMPSASKLLPPSHQSSQNDPNNLQWTKIRISYLVASMMSHSCVPSAEQSISSLEGDLKFVLRAIRPIKKGEQITISYTDLLEPTILRQTKLMNDKLFTCQCTRCIDPVELETNCGTLKCFTCLKTNKKPSSQLLPSKDDNSIWKCNSCKTDVKYTKVQSLLAKIKDDISIVEKPECTVQEAEKLLKKYSQLLHDGHGLLLRIKYQLCGMYGRSHGFLLQDLSLQQLDRKRVLCEDVLKFLDIIQPYTSRQGVILYELSCSLVTIGKHQMALDKQKAEQNLKQSLSYLRKSLKILENEAEGTFEFDLALGGKETLAALENYFK